MTIAAVKEILKGSFADEADRKYWEDKLAEMIQKEKTAKQNERYLKKMSVYDR